MKTTSQYLYHAYAALESPTRRLLVLALSVTASAGALASDAFTPHDTPSGTASSLAVQSANKVLALDGIDEYVSIPSDPRLQHPSQFSFEAWFHPRPSAANHFGTVVNKGDGLTGASARSYEARWTGSSGQLAFNVYLDPVADLPHYFTLEAPVSADRWTHLGGTFDGSAGIMRLYTNGVLAAQLDGQGVRRMRQTTLPLLIGATPPHAGTFASGYVDEVRIWRRVRSGDEIRNEMGCRLTENESGLSGYWTFDGGSAAGENGINGTFVGGASVVSITGASALETTCRPVEIVTIPVSGGRALWNVRGPIGAVFNIESSSDLTGWRPHSVLPTLDGRYRIDIAPSNAANEFFRVHRR